MVSDFRGFRKTVAPMIVWFPINETWTENKHVPERQAIHLD